MEMLGWRLCYGSSTSYLMTWLWIPYASSRSSTYECVGPLRTFHPLLTSRFTFQHLPAFVFCLFCVVVWFCCFGVFLFPVCECLGIPNSPRSLDLDDRQGLIARSAMQQKKNNNNGLSPENTSGFLRIRLQIQGHLLTNLCPAEAAA